MKYNFNILHVADLHACPGDAYTFFNNQLLNFIDYVIMNKHNLDLIVFSGDLFKKRYPTDSPETEVMVRFMSNLMFEIKDTNIQVVIFPGTYSHDGDQLKIFESLVPFSNFHIFYEAKEVYDICDGLNIRVIPETHHENYDEWKKNVFTDPNIHCTFFHGLIKGALSIAEKKPGSLDGIVNSKSAVVMLPEDLENYTSICTCGGHIHTRMKCSDNVWYTGSFCAASFADAGEEKGWDLISVDTSNNTYTVNHIKNEYSDVYRILNMTSDFSSLSLDALKNRMECLKNALKSYVKVRIDVDITNFNQLMIDNVNIIKGLYQSFFSFKIIRNIITDSTKQQNIESNASFALDKGIQIEEKIQNILSQKGIHIELNKIKEILDIPIDMNID